MMMPSTTEESTSPCLTSEFGCCPDGVTSATGVNLEGCIGIDFDNCTYSGNENDTGKNNLLYLKLK